MEARAAGIGGLLGNAASSGAPGAPERAAEKAGADRGSWGRRGTHIQFFACARTGKHKKKIEKIPGKLPREVSGSF
jgi:hypothetical protein